MIDSQRLFVDSHLYLFRITNSFWPTKFVSCVWIMKNEWIMHGSVINNHVSEGSLEQHGILIYLENPPVLAIKVNEMKWNESGFRPPLCTYRLNWARRTSWGWWDDWDDTVLQTQDSKFEPWRSEAEHATSRSRRLPTILTFTRGWGWNNFVSFKPPRRGTEPRTLAWKATVGYKSMNSET